MCRRTNILALRVPDQTKIISITLTLLPRDSHQGSRLSLEWATLERCIWQEMLLCLVFASLFTFTIKLQSPTFVVVFFWCHVWEGWSCPPSPLSPPPPLGDRRYTWDTRESYRRQGGHDTNSFSILADFMEKFVKKLMENKKKTDRIWKIS